jgi:hypothetical protein
VAAINSHAQVPSTPTKSSVAFGRKNYRKVLVRNMSMFEDERDLLDSIRYYSEGAGSSVETGKNAGEVYEVLWEIALHLGGFLAVGIVANLLLALFGVA